MKLLAADGWIKGPHTRHGTAFYKDDGGEVRTTVIPNKSDSLPIGTLRNILGQKQTALGRKGFLRLLRKYK